MHPITLQDPRYAGRTGRWDNLDEWVCVVDDAMIPVFRERERERVEKIVLDAEIGLGSARKHAFVALNLGDAKEA